jgi:hypothetical protein
MNTYNGQITTLDKNEVFVFGSNLLGFHGAGSAGFATFNVPGNHWREYDYDEWPDGTQGCWNIKGVGWGYQIGTLGASYAIPTVTQAGKRRSMPLEKIAGHVRTFYNFARALPDWKFFVAQEDKVGYNGYAPDEMAKTWGMFRIPENVWFSDLFAPILEEHRKLFPQ